MVNDQDGKPTTEEGENAPQTASGEGGNGGIGRTLARLAYAPATKFFIIGFLVILLLIPLFMVWGLVSERRYRAAAVQTDIVKGWGHAQTIRGPILVVPYRERVIVEKDDKKETRMVTRHAAFLPDDLKVSGAATTTMLRRSIYQMAVFNGDLTLTGSFGRLAVDSLDESAIDVQWRDAVLAINLTALASLKNSVVLKRPGQADVVFEPSLGLGKLGGRHELGIHAKPFADRAGSLNSALSTDGFSFTIPLQFTGSRSLAFAPVGRQNQVELTSDWAHPSFEGLFLPAERTVSDDGFTAHWNVPHLARPVPQAFRLSGQPFDGFSAYDFGVRFFVPVDYYSLVDRALKYGILFISAAFSAVFLLELLSGHRFHAVQYLFTGLAMILFYVLLLSLSEHIGFLRAFLAAAAATGGVLALYIGKALANRRNGWMMFAVFAVLYGLLYLLLRMEDYALLAGTLAAFAMLTVIMFATLRIDWSGRSGPRAVRQEAGKGSAG